MALRILRLDPHLLLGLLHAGEHHYAVAADDAVPGNCTVVGMARQPTDGALHVLVESSAWTEATGFVVPTVEQIVPAEPKTEFGTEEFVLGADVTEEATPVVELPPPLVMPTPPAPSIPRRGRPPLRRGKGR